ncbi:MAG: hypothetical protein WC744_02495 [Patescibacteria group bacterium]|jgi:hypothetical protein
MKNYKSILKIIKFLVVFFIINFSFLTLNLSKANAQQVSLSLSPPVVELFIKPGKEVIVAYKLENLGDPTFLSLKVLPFEAKDGLGNIKIKSEFEGPVRFSLDNSDLKLDQPFFLKTNDSQQILLRIRIPENIFDSDYYYSLLAESTPPTAAEGTSSVRVKATIGSNILITVSNSGDVDVKPKIALFTTKGKYIFDSMDKVPVILTIVNKGRNMIKPEGQIKLKGNFGETAQYDIIPKNILAESERLLEATPSALLTHSTSLILSGFFIGKYNLSTQIKFGENSPTVFGSTTFYAFPFKITVGILIAVVIVVIIVKKYRKNKEE